jgi:hypothetical protein
MDASKLLAKRFIAPNGCWEWTGYVAPNGYGQIGSKKVHRVSFEVFKGPITKPEVCHTCDNRKCFNPEHLFNGTKSDNQRDSVNKKRHTNSKKTHCSAGHPLSGKNLRVRYGKRECRECVKRRDRIKKKQAYYAEHERMKK